MKKNNRFIFIITCLLITINCSSLFGTAGLNKQLNVFVNENNLMPRHSSSCSSVAPNCLALSKPLSKTAAFRPHHKNQVV